MSIFKRTKGKWFSLASFAFVAVIFFGLGSLSYSNSFSQKTYAQGCTNADCPGGRACQGGTMCCTGGGCPSYSCDTDADKTCSASGTSNGWICTCTEKVCVPVSYTVTKTKTETYRCDWRCTYTWHTYQCGKTFCKRVCQWFGCYNECKYIPKTCKYKVGDCGYKRECRRTVTYTEKVTEACGSQKYVETKKEYTARGTCRGCSAGGNDDSGGGGGTTPPPTPTTCSTNPAAVSLVSPSNGSTINDTKDVTFDWDPTSNWGADCSTSRSYTLQVDDEDSFADPKIHNTAYNSSTTSADVTFTSLGTHYWRVRACNAHGCSNSATWNFDLQCGVAPGAASNPTPADGANDVNIPVTTEWDAPADWGTACGQANNNTYTVFAKVKTGATCDDPGATYSAVPTCTGLASSRTDCADPFFNVRNTDFCWYVETSNGTETTLSATSGSEVWDFRTADPALYQNWVTTLFGDFYAGGLSVQYPSPSQYVAPWDPPHAAYDDDGAYPEVSLLSSNNVDITTSDTSNDYSPESESGLWVEYADFKQTWPSNYRGTPPASATSLPLSGSCDEIFTGSNKLDPFEVYEGDASCISDAINAVDGSPNGYELDDDGYAVVFVTGSSDLQIDNAFTTDNDDYRVVFVTGPDVSVVVNKDLELAANPDFDSEPLIEAAFIVTKDIEFEGVASDPLGDPAVDPDGSIMVEGPIIARTINFNRNRGTDNQYPSEIVKYNPNYIYNLTEQERNSLKSNGSGLFVIDVEWTSEE